MNGIDAVSGGTLRLASEDASFRRYFRVTLGDESFIVMDAPPEQEDCLPFMRVAGYLEAMQLNAPRIIEANTDDGFLLLTDLGTTQYLTELTRDQGAAPSLYADAIRALNDMQSRGTAFQAHLPPYDEALLSFELSLFHDWLCGKHLGIDFTDVEEAEWQKLSDVLIKNALDQPSVFVHRDYHSRNLMVTAGNNPGILDFQDAVEGPLTYDLVSLLKDCYVRWEPGQIANWTHIFYRGLDTAIQQQVDREVFARYFDLMGVQRHLKAAGIFARLNHRDGKPGFMLDVPRTLGYIVDLESSYPELEFLVDLISNRCLPLLESTS